MHVQVVTDEITVRVRIIGILEDEQSRAIISIGAETGTKDPATASLPTT